MELTLPGTNFSDMMEPTSTISKVRYLKSLMLRTKKESMSVVETRIPTLEVDTNNGKSSMLTKPPRKSPRV
jgi:hypothetical protein